MGSDNVGLSGSSCTKCCVRIRMDGGCSVKSSGFAFGAIKACLVDCSNGALLGCSGTANRYAPVRVGRTSTTTSSTRGTATTSNRARARTGNRIRSNTTRTS